MMQLEPKLVRCSKGSKRGPWGWKKRVKRVLFVVISLGALVHRNWNGYSAHISVTRSTSEDRPPRRQSRRLASGSTRQPKQLASRESVWSLL